MIKLDLQYLKLKLKSKEGNAESTVRGLHHPSAFLETRLRLVHVVAETRIIRRSFRVSLTDS
jgi:hypothetical protein